MIYPKVGEKFYWKDLDNVIYEETCLKIEEEDNPDLETMFFTEITKNGGGVFVTESDILNPNSKEVKNFKKEQAEKKVKEITYYIKQDDVQSILFNKLIKKFNWEDTTNILNILTHE